MITYYGPTSKPVGLILAAWNRRRANKEWAIPGLAIGFYSFTHRGAYWNTALG